MRKVLLILVAITAFICLDVSQAGASSSHQRSEFIKAVHRESPSTKQFSNKNLESIGSLSCNALNEGGTVSDLIKVYYKSSHGPLTSGNYGFILANAVLYLCPNQTARVATQLRKLEGKN